MFEAASSPSSQAFQKGEVQMPIKFNPATGTFKQTAAAPKKPRECPWCHSQRESTRVPIEMQTTDGEQVGKKPCTNDWHNPDPAKQSDGRIGGASRTPDPTRSQPF
jgi:hypothetical protein